MDYLRELYPGWIANLKRKSLKAGQQIYAKKLGGQRFDLPVPVESLPEDVPPDFLLPARVKSRAFYPLLRKDSVSKRRKEIEGNRRLVKKNRPITFASYEDSLIFSWYSNILSEHYETRLQTTPVADSVIGYRPAAGRKKGKSTIDRAIDFFKVLFDGRAWTVFAIDIEDFYGSLSHQRIKMAWKDILGVKTLTDDQYAVFSATVRPAVINKGALRYAMLRNGMRAKNGIICSIQNVKKLITQKDLDWTDHTKSEKNGVGIPQGLSISPVLSNIYMLPFDTKVFSRIQEHSGHYLRYADDVIIAIPTNQLGDFDVNTFLCEQALEVGLTISPDKTQMRTVQFTGGQLTILNDSGEEDELDYLGIVLNKRGIRARQRALTKFGHRIERVAALVAGGKISRSTARAMTRTRIRDQNYLLRVENKADMVIPELPTAARLSRVFHRARNKVARSLKKSVVRHS